MSNFSDAVRSMLEDEAECPNPTCRAKNARGNHVIKIDIHNGAWCSQCGHEWDVEDGHSRRDTMKGTCL